MATTRKFYRIGDRLPRYTTKLSAFANGMYLTKQVIPEGYARVMINYDIDDTGSNIRPRQGRKKLQTFNYDSPKLGTPTLSDYIYAYTKDEKEVTGVRDLVASYGLYTKISDLVSLDKVNYKRPVYVSFMKHITDNSVAEFSEEEGYVVTSPGEVTEVNVNEFWALDYNKDTEQFQKVSNRGIGYVTARTISNAYAFNKPFKDSIGRPIGAVVNNEIVTFAGDTLVYEEYPANPERNSLSNFGRPILSKLKLRDTGSGYEIYRDSIKIRTLNVLEAANTGYNLIHPEPYMFENEQSGSVTIMGALFYRTDDSRKPVFMPKIGKPMLTRVYYTYPSTETEIQVKIEVIDLTRTNSDWEVLEDFSIKVKGGNPIEYTYTPVYQQSIMRITLREGSNQATETTLPITISCGESTYENLEGKTFDLSTCKGMISWQGCVGVYGVDNALDTIFFSDVEDPGYFPFPNNIASFDNEILAVHNYLDYLLVITVDSIWLMSPGKSIAASTQKRILSNIHIPEIDAINLVVLKDEIFFKTDTQFYVLKPNKYTSNATDLKNYVNSTAIANYTMDFQVETVKLLNEVYRNIWQELTISEKKQIRFVDFDVLDTVSLVKDSEVHYIYTIKPILTDGITLDKLNLHLVYNTVTRSWRMYFMAVGGSDTYYSPLLYRNKQSGAYYEFFPHAKHDNTSSLVIAARTNETADDNVSDGSWNLTTGYNNYTYLDTGNVAIDDTSTKRFREVQFNLMNIEHTMLNFFVDFKVDGLEQIQATRYEMKHITDKEDPEYGKIFVTPIECSNMSLKGVTALADNVTEADYFALDFAKFPDLNIATVRFELKGRGRRGAVQMLNTSLKPYELSDMTWVYRTMNAR